MNTGKTNPRGFCATCLRAPLNCYCRFVRAFEPRLRFVILTHVRETQKHVATGRLAHLCLKRSLLVRGFEFGSDETVNALIADQRNHCVALYPGAESLNLSSLSPAERASLLPAGREPVVFVIDGTWATARKSMARSPNLRSLPRFSFDPPAPSRIRLRLQPEAECLTTLEAIHHTIELLGPARGFDTALRAHDGMLHALDAMVDEQIALGAAHNPRWWGAKIPALSR